MFAGPASPGSTLAARVSAGVVAIPLFVAVCLFAGGILLAQTIWLNPPLLLCAIGAASVTCGVAAIRAPRVVWIGLSVLWVMLGAWCAQMEPQPAPNPQLLQLSDGLLRIVEGTVTDAAPARVPSDAAQNDADADLPVQRVDLRLSSIELVDDLQDRQVSNNGGVRLTIRWPDDNLVRFHCGERIRAAVRLLPPQNYRTPGAWNHAEYLLQQGVTSTASVRIERIERLGATLRFAPSCFFKEAQHTVTERLMAWPASLHRWPAFLRLSEDDTAMLSAMVSGDRTFLTHTIRIGFERTGSFHMLVVAGFHLAIVAGCVFWIARKLRIPQIPATFVTIACSTLYALFTGFATPVQRSLFMVTLYLIGRLFFRERSVLNTIGFAALCLLAVSPRVLFDSGFQMTLLAVVSIGGVATPLLHATVTPYLRALQNLRQVIIDAKLAPAVAQFRVTVRMFAARLGQAGYPRLGWRILPGTLRFLLRTFEALIVSIVIELAMTMPMAMYFHRVTLFALPVNMLIIPILLVLLPAALLTVILLLIWPAAAVIPGCFTAIVLHLGVKLVHLFGSFESADLRIPTPHAWQVAVFCALIGAAILFARSQARWLRRLAWATLLLSAIAPVIPNPVQHPEDALLVETLDVGQGDSHLLVTPDGKTMLIDAGGPSGGRRSRASQEFDVGEEVVSPALWTRSIRHLDVVAISHTHSDHMGGMIAVLRNFHPNELWVGNNPDTPAYRALLAEARRIHTTIRQFHAGESARLGSVRVNVLAPFSDYMPGPDPANNDSLVLRAQYGSTSVLLEGDAEAAIEQRMLTESDLSSNLLKVGHHGSTTSTQPSFLARVAPRWAVISCGQRNRFGHPRAEVLNELQQAYVRTFSTDVNGSTCFYLDGTNVRTEPCVP